MLTSLGVATAGWVPAVVIVQRWYPQRMGTMLGFTSAGIGVGIFLVGPLSQVLIDLVGWRDAYRALAVLIALGGSSWPAGGQRRSPSRLTSYG